MEPQSFESSDSLTLPTAVAFLIAVLVLGIGAVFYFNRPFVDFVIANITGGSKEQVTAKESISLIESGDWANAAKRAEPVLKSGGRSTGAAGTAYEIGTFYTGTFEDRIKAVQFTKSIFYANENNPLMQALEVNTLLSYIQIAMDPRINKEIFKGEPFEKLWVPKDLSSSIKNLAEFSLALYPTNNAHFHTAVWYVDRIRNLYGNWKATPAEKKEYANEILRIIGTVDKTFAENAQQMEGRSLGYMERFFMMYSKVYFYSAVSRVYPTYLAQTKTALAELEIEYEAMKARAGGYNAFAATRIPDAYFAYAGALVQTKGAEAKPEIATTLDKLVSFVESDPKPHEGFYLSYIRMDRSKWKEASKQRALRAYYDLAAIHPPFKQFLERNGWVF